MSSRAEFPRAQTRTGELASHGCPTSTECIERINDRRHTRFGVSRRARFETVEKAALKPLPIGDVDCGEWKDATLHPDSYVYVEGDYYSAPHIHWHKRLRLKTTENPVEIFLRLERLAIHPRSRHRSGRRIKIDAHFPPPFAISSRQTG